MYTIRQVSLTKREIQVVSLIAAGCSNRQIARRLHISVYTAKNHVHNVLQKLDLETRTAAAVWYMNQHHQRDQAKVAWSAVAV